MQFSAAKRKGTAGLDPIFVDACDPGTLKLLFVHSDDPDGIGESVFQLQGNKLSFVIPESLSIPRNFRITVLGIRRKKQGFRLPVIAADVAAKNQAFWRSACEGAPK